MVVVTVGGESYYINRRLKELWDNIKDGKLKKLDEDRVYVVDGRERTGKSVFALQQAAYIDPTLINDMSRITFTVEDTIDAIRKTDSNDKETKAIIFDEAFRGLSSKSAISKTNKELIQALMEMGQKNLVLFLVSPSFFYLELYAAVIRSHGLFHIIKEKGSGKRSFRAFSYRKKGILYRRGIKKGWSYNINTRFRDWYFNKYPGGKNFEIKYKAKKSRSLMGTETIKKELGSEEKRELRRGIVKKAMEIGYGDKKKLIAELFGVDVRTIQDDFKKISSNTPEIIPKTPINDDNEEGNL